jgi:hypothetical protein
VPDHPGRAEHHAALRAERLGERRGAHHVGGPGQPGGGHRAAPARAEHAEAVRVVHQQPGAVLAADRGQRSELRGVAVHREDAVAHHQGGARVAVQRLADGGRVGVRDDADLGPGEPATVDQRGVVGAVRDDQGAAPAQRGDRGEVGGVAGGEDQGGLEAAELREFRLQFGVQLGAPGDQPGAGGPGAPAQARLGPGPHHLGVPGQAQVVVPRQVEQLRLGGGPGAQRAHQTGPAPLLGVRVDPLERVAAHRSPVWARRVASPAPRKVPRGRSRSFPGRFRSFLGRFRGGSGRRFPAGET